MPHSRNRSFAYRAVGGEQLSRRRTRAIRLHPDADMDLIGLLAHCAPTVHPDTMQRVVQVESSFNPYAIGVVGARLKWQPRSQAEALATIRWLDMNGYNYSVGLAQVNKRNFRAHGLTPETALMACPNLRAGGAILTACFSRASKSHFPQQAALRAAFSCYESGNFITGFRDGYVRKIVEPSTTSSLPGHPTPQR